jgi:hypothetical protein
METGTLFAPSFWVGNLVAVEMQNREARPVAGGTEKPVGMSRRGQRSGFRLAVANDAGDDEIWIVKHRRIVGGSPAGVHLLEQVGRKSSCSRGLMLLGNRFLDPVFMAIVMSMQSGLVIPSYQRLFRVFR